MANVYNTGSFSPAGWRINLQPTPPPYTPWVTSVPATAQSATNNGGFSFVYDDIPTPIKRKSLAIPLPSDAPVNVALTGYTDTLTGGYFVNPNQLYLGPNIGINLGVQTILDLGPALVPGGTGNQINGYGSLAGVQIGSQALVNSVFVLSYQSGVVLGSSANDGIKGLSYGVGSGGIENYGQILLAGGSDNISATAGASALLGYGLINWGLIETGSNDDGRDGGDSITGIGSLYGIRNSTGNVTTNQPPTIRTGAGADLISGQSSAGNYGIWNDGLVDMGVGNDTYQSTVSSDGSTSLFGGTGTVVMGAGIDVVTGFGSGTFYGDGLGEVVAARWKGKTLNNYDTLNMIQGSIYTVAATSATGNRGQTINGFTITSNNSPLTMTVYGFEAIGVAGGATTTLAAGTYDFSTPTPPV